MAQEELNEFKLFENVPMQLNLSDYELRSHLGWVAAFKNEETGAIRLDIRLSPEASERLGDDLINVLDLKAIGFAGFMRKPEVLTAAKE